ncbi:MULTISPECIES: hypothetical protein [unclassified Leifsonia]|uniref:hypothetical protein n=1 Tax=unclassified Leifsonia TaxID=2663824 RepID=UPI000701D048|nr:MULTISPECIES: hypothetical protein [unclassified Leifsonia]KQX05069.1 hypothetical protein ASC59_12655 [Leifsonia sp. Root1293]KRA08701.1 hypothetical protein ASD61_12655 [Leifsonia sp. Root60]
MPEDALIAVADELYALAPSEFTAARNARAQAVRSDDRALSESIRALKKPTPAAWLVNQLVRHRSAELREVLDLGDELRDAQERRDGPELSRLTRTRRTAVADLGRDAAALAEELGSSVGRPTLDEVEQTVTAGIADAAATDAVLSGRLLRPLMTVGFDPVDLDGAVAGGPAPVAQPMRPVEDLAARREKKRREQAANEADKAAASARRALDDAQGRIATAERRRGEAEHERDDLEDRLRLATKKLTEAEDDLSKREDERDKAEAALKRAESVAEAARADLDER